MEKYRRAAFFGMITMNVGLLSYFQGFLSSQGHEISFLFALTIVAVSDICFLTGFYLEKVVEVVQHRLQNS